MAEVHIYGNVTFRRHSPLYSAEVKNAWNYTSTPPIRLNGVVLS